MQFTLHLSMLPNAIFVEVMDGAIDPMLPHLYSGK